MKKISKKSLIKNKKNYDFRQTNSNESLEGYVGLPYLRVSSKRQEIEGTGLQSQEKRCLLELSRREIPHEKSFFDSFSGGGDFMNRPAMRDLLHYIDNRAHMNFVVIFDDLKRFARDTEFHLKLRAAFRIRGVILLCLNYSFEDSPEGMFVETVFAASNQLDREQNRRQVIQKQKARLEGGYRAFPAVKGYIRTRDAIHGKIDLLSDNTEEIQEALEGFANKRFLYKIDGARFLQEKGVISNKQSAEKAIQTFSKMLQEVFYAGYIEYEPWGVTRRIGHHKPVISLETYEKNQRRLNEKQTTFVRQDVREGFELRGLVNCAECLQKMTGAPSTSKTGKKFNYYKCANKECVLYGKSIGANIIHEDFTKLLKQIKPTKEIINLTADIFKEIWEESLSKASKNNDKFQSEKVRLENEIEKLSHLVMSTSSDIVIKQYEKQIEKVANRIEELEEEIALIYDYSIPYRTSVDDVLDVLMNPYAAWMNYDLTQKRRFYSFLFSSNLVYSKKEGYRTPDYTLPIRLFEEISTTNSYDVEMAGIEPASIWVGEQIYILSCFQYRLQRR